MRLLPLLFLPLLALPDAVAQEAVLPVEPGDRVRVTFHAERDGERGERYRWTGEIRELRGDTLLFYYPETEAVVPLPFATLDRLELSTGRVRPVGRSVLIGAGVGAAVASAPLVFALAADGCAECTIPPYVFIIGFAAVGAGFGALVGLGIGLIPRERWETVPMPEGISLGPARDGLGVGLLWRFPTGGRR